MDAAVHDEVPDHLAGDRVLGGLVDPDLAHPGPRLKEKVVQEVHLEVAGVKHVLARPGLASGTAGSGARRAAPVRTPTNSTTFPTDLEPTEHSGRGVFGSLRSLADTPDSRNSGWCLTVHEPDTRPWRRRLFGG